ncbi:heterokaryon incompatibility protein-domain-containing protein [Rhexocercosporidium sp. MPI-PUGE-AT-0058]|nr:heterokaryon incompatibility protein-domain-containing protein [Rhexocercosporidium sp. MPI-PUGE-AT-0058]
MVNRAHEPQPSQKAPSEPLPASVAAKPGKLRILTDTPIAQLRPLLALPATTLGASGEGIEGRAIVKVQPPKEICPICCNLNAFHAPQDGDGSTATPSWAAVEYQIPKGIPVGKKTVEDSKALLDSAASGCFYCAMVQVALSAIHPGWDAERSVLDIHLAPDLPVVIRLHFGKLSNIQASEEDMLDFGAVVPKGQNMTFTISIVNRSKPDIEIELYRPRLRPDELTVGDLVLMPLAQQIGFAEETVGHSGSQQCFEFMKRNIARCIKDHNCGGGKNQQLPLLPDRVIWLKSPNPSHMCLLEPKNTRARYIALSYCWGPVSPSTYLTSETTFAARKAGMRFQDLPPLFQDVVQCAHLLEIEYIWIDRLCIIQGGDDFKTQAPKMGSVYGNATLTIAAASATSEMERILTPRDTKWQWRDLDMDVSGIGTLNLRARRRSHALSTESKGGDYGKVSTRAWIWQERLLAARSIFFTPSAIKFECNQHSVWEGFDSTTNVTGHSWSNQLATITHHSWLLLVQEFTSRDCTRASDRLPALSSVMARIAATKTGWKPRWGMWEHKIVESLAWKTMEKSSRVRRERAMNPEWYAPSWSWASVDAPVSYTQCRADTALEALDPFVCDVVCHGVDDVTGCITLEGYLVACGLVATITPSPSDDDEEGEGEGKLIHTYATFFSTLTSTSTTKQVLQDGFTPDVPLMYSPEQNTAIRVPYGAAVPTQTWASECYCLLLGKREMRADVLYLGKSLRVEGALERIGMVSGVFPGVFGQEGKERLVVDVV